MMSGGGDLFRFSNGSWQRDTGLIPIPGRGETQSGPDIIYLNMGLINANQNLDTLSDLPKIAQFTETRSSTIIEDASKWDYSIVRFNLEGCGALLPLWVPQIETGQTNPYLTVYKVQIGSTTTPPPGNINPPTAAIFETCFPSLPPPRSPVAAQDLTNVQYFAKSYTQFCHMINNALDTNTTGVATTVPPKLSYDVATKTFKWILPAEYVDHNPTHWLSVNAPLAALLSGFDWRYDIAGPTGNPQIQPRFYTLNIEEQDFPDPALLYTVQQDFPSTNNGLWAPIDGFSFVTNFIPVNPEQGTSPTQIGTSNLGVQGSQTSYAFANVLTDYNVTGFPEDALSSTEYVPSAEYRMANLAGHSSIQAVDVQVFWRYRLTGEVLNLYLPNNSSVGLKVMFRRKRS